MQRATARSQYHGTTAVASADAPRRSVPLQSQQHERHPQKQLLAALACLQRSC
jgi:hypothetical protein